MIDTTKATIARVYDAFLDSKDNDEIDWQFMNEDGGEGTALAHQIETCFHTNAVDTSRYRTRAEIQAMLACLDLLESGLVELDQWWPGGPALTPPYLSGGTPHPRSRRPQAVALTRVSRPLP